MDDETRDLVESLRGIQNAGPIIAYLTREEDSDDTSDDE